MNNETINIENIETIENTKTNESKDLLHSDRMVDENGKAIQVSMKTSEGNREFLKTLPGKSHHENISILRAVYEEAERAKITVAFADNMSIINNCLEGIRAQVEAISKGISTEEARIKRDFIYPLSDKITKYENEVEDIEELISQVDRLSKENEKLASDLDKSKNLNESKEKIISENIDTINELTAESRNLMKANKLMSDKIDELNNGIEKELSEQRDEYEKSLKEKDDTISGLNKDIDSLKLERDQLGKTEESLREEIKTLKSDKLEAENEYKKQILDLNVDKNNAEFEVKSLAMEKEKLESENASLNTSIEQFKTRQKELEDKVKELSIDKNTLEVKVEELKGLVSSHNKNIGDKQTEINKLEGDLKKEIKLRQEKEHEIVKLKIMLDELESKLKPEADKKAATDKKTKSK